MRSHLTVLLVFFAALSLYSATLAPTFLWSDSAKLAIRVHDRAFAGIGFDEHPLHTVLGYLFSMLPMPLARSLNLMSACFAAATVALLYVLIFSATRDALAAFSGALALAVSHTFWMYSVITETYAPLCFFLVSSVLLARRWLEQTKDRHLYLLAALAGATFALHGMAALFALGWIALLWSRDFFRFLISYRVVVALACLAGGAAPVLILPVFHGASAGDVYRALAGTTSAHTSVFAGGMSQLLRELPRYPFYLAYQFPGAGIVFAAWGFWAGWRSHLRLQMALLFFSLPVVGFASQYFFQRQFPFLIPSYLVASVWIGLGVASLRTSRPLLRTRKGAIVLTILIGILPPFLYYATYRYAATHGIALPIRRLPYRDEARYFFFPPKNMERGAERYVADAFRQAAPGAIVIGDFNPSEALLYGQKVLHQRSDIDIRIVVDPWVLASRDPAGEITKYVGSVLGEKRPVYLADGWEPYYHLAELRKRFRVERDGGPLWRVRPKESP